MPAAFPAGGCGGAKAAKIAEPAPPPIDEHLGRVLPEAVTMAIGIDLAQMRGTLPWEGVRFLEDDEGFTKLKAATGIDPLNDVDEVLLVADDRGGREDHVVAAIKGRFDARAVVAEIIRTENGSPVELRGLLGSVDEDLVVLALTERTLLAGTPAAIEDALAAAFDGAPCLADDPVFSPVADSRDAVSLLYRRGTTAPDFSRFGARRMPLEDVEQIRAIDARLGLAQGLVASVVLTTTTRLEAAGLAKDLRSSRRDLSQNPIALLLGVDWLFEKIEINLEGSTVEITVDLDDDDLLQIRRLFERLEKIRSLAGDAGPLRR